MADADTMTTAEQLLALPEDDVERDLIRGELREKPMTRRGRNHTRTCSRIAHLLSQWLESQASPRAEVLAGEAGFRIGKNPDTTAGIDVAAISAEVATRHPEDAFLINDIPTLAVEILSPSDTHQEITEKVRECRLTACLESFEIWSNHRIGRVSQHPRIR